MSTQTQPVEIVICMGSSCYSRGNSRTLLAIQEYLWQQKLEAKLVGHLCEGECSAGPNISIAGQRHRQVDAATAVGLLQDCGKSRALKDPGAA